MPQIEPKQPSATQDKAKVTKSTPPGGSSRSLPLHTRDPRAGSPAKDRNPNKAYG